VETHNSHVHGLIQVFDAIGEVFKNTNTENRLPDITMDQLEKVAIIQALKTHGGSKAKASKALDIGLKTLYRKIEKYEIEI